MEAVHADWKEYLNLLICEESHLKYMEDYHQVSAGARPQWWGCSVPPWLTCGLGTASPEPRSAHTPNHIHGRAPSLLGLCLSSPGAGAGESDSTGQRAPQK